MTSPTEPRPFWQHPALILLPIVAGAVPLLLPAIPPLVDLPGHMARYHVALNLDHSALLQRYYSYHLALAGNLGMDLLVVPLAKLFGLELGTKLLVMSIPMMLIAGFLLVAREIHGRLPPTAFFALPLAYCWPVQFGFVNFSISTAFCFLAFALWLRLRRAGRLKLRALLFVPLASLVWLAHIYGWGLLGILAFSAEASARREGGKSWPRSFLEGARACLPLMLPFLFMVIWRGGAVEGGTGDWDPGLKLLWLASILREHWRVWDLASAGLLFALILAALLGRHLRLVPFARLALLLLFLLFLAIPRVLVGSGYADMRLAPMLVAVGVLGIGCDATPLRHARAIAAIGLLFFATRIAVTTSVFDAIGKGWQKQLVAIDHIRPGSRVLALDYAPCVNVWASQRFDHVSSLAVPRRDIFTNGQFVIRGALMLDVKYERGAPFVIDPSHLVRQPGCGDGPSKIQRAVEIFPKAFDYLWIVGVPQRFWPSDPTLVPVWQDGTGILYRNPRPPPT